MNMLGMCAVFCLMIINTVDVCDAECEEYVIVFEEITCPSHVKLTPLKRRDIHWDKVTYPCNSTDKNSGKKKCVVEFDCWGTQGSCQNHIKKVNHQTHSFIDNTMKPKPITSTTETLEVPKKIITVEEKPHHTVDEEFNTSKYDVNLIYIKDNVIHNSSKTTCETCTLFCYYAETVCNDGGRPENYSLGDVKNVTNNIHHIDLAGALEISINRDETSPVQPLFTGYFLESFNDSSSNYNDNFEHLKTVTLSCSTLKYNNCKQNIENKSSKQINVYIKANYIENNTITKYPDCTKNSITSENVLYLKCEDILFAKHNLHIVQTPPAPPSKQELSTWHCQITELNTLFSKEQRNENSKMQFINCSSETKIGNGTPISDSKTISSYNILTKNGINTGNTGISNGKEEINIDPSPETNSENIITIIIKEKGNNCSDNSNFNINEGKIIDLGINNNKEKILHNNNVELILSNCLNVNCSTINETQPHPKVELNIILKSESLNDTNLKQFNGTAKVGSVKQRILLRCDHPNLDSNNIVLQCESIDLDLYNITGIEISTKVRPTLHANNTKEKKKGNVKMVKENHNQTKVNAEVNKNINFTTNKTLEKNESTANTKSNENNIKLVKNKEVQKNILESNENDNREERNIEVQKKISESKETSKTFNFNRKKDIPNGAGQNSLALGNPETEKILLIALLTIASVAILIVIAWQACSKKREYDPAPTREPPDEEETAF